MFNRRRKKRPKTIARELRVINVQDKQVPVRVFYENRRNSRVSIVQDGVNIRIAAYLNQKEREEQINNFLNWTIKTLHKKRTPLISNLSRDYTDGQEVQVGKKTFLIKLFDSENKYARVTLFGNEVRIKVSPGLDNLNRNLIIGKLLSRMVAHAYLPEITERVHQLNQNHVQKPIQSVRLKNNSSNWGSCSSKGNINLSTRLLFAPDEVVDYVIIHELTHLIHQNHSANFWKRVEMAMPDYKNKEKWLKQNSHLCVF